MSDHRAQEVLQFWFDPALDAAQRNRRWFGKDAAFDAEIRRRFLGLYEEGAAGRLGAWQGSVRECLALVILLDQFPRNLFSGEARAFAADGLARAGRPRIAAAARRAARRRSVFSPACPSSTASRSTTSASPAS